MEEITDRTSSINALYQDEPGDGYNVTNLEFSKKNQPNQNSKDVIFHFPAILKETPHRESILRICPTADSNFMLMGQDGLISFWSSNLMFVKSRSLFVQEKSRKVKWIADFILINQYNKFLIGTCDREIRMYELSNFEPYCQIIGLQSVPLRLDYSSTGNNECVIVYGDDQGCVNILLMSMMGESLRNWTKGPIVDGIPSITIEKLASPGLISYIRWKAHNDWVTEIKYIRSINKVISSCNEETTALVVGCVIGTKSSQQKMKEIQDAVHNMGRHVQTGKNVLQRRLSCDEAIFLISKGAKTFDFCKEKNLLVTGGLDRIIRMWNPNFPGRPIGRLAGHNSPIVFLSIAAGDSRIFSISVDKIIKVWDIEDQTCLITVKPKDSQINGDLATCYHSQELKALYIATDSLAQLLLQSRKELNIGVSHKKPILCCQYNKLMRQVVTCCEGSDIKVWDLNTGQLVFEFTRAHGDAAITCMTFDADERRLITGGRDGCVKKWDYQSGQCIQTLRQAGEKTEEISDCIYAEIYKNGFIISVGWDKKINVFPDIQGDLYDTQYPSHHWADDATQKNGHKDDILSVVLCAPNLLATSSYDGEIIIWNFTSGLIFCRLHSPISALPQELSGENLTVNKLLCIRSRTSCAKTSATVIASGPRGHIHFWNIFHGGKLLARFLCSSYKATVSSMSISEDSAMLYAADQHGYIYIFHILHYTLHGPETDPPKTLTRWRAHECSITSIALVEEHQLLLTSSMDCSVKLWNIKGEHLGIFGQSKSWNIHSLKSEKHQEALVKQVPPESRQSLQSDTRTNKKVKNRAEDAQSLFEVKYQEVAKELEQLDSFVKMRLREHKQKHIEKQQIYGKLTAYQSLHCHELADISVNIHKPDPAAELNDLFDII
ncbi:WD repeat-containing protein 64-like isoform X2 [Stegostoma tigrinum]|uniref:WD repeat-containing protein 64-like isoform X2 n=1 Tax=Stegostoma tigrinum TaxID=3053191 RepID=UPI002870891B|nr:WD repeat-containing protein 64-like isoform X2 [Stegostoma tigrinum]